MNVNPEFCATTTANRLRSVLEVKRFRFTLFPRYDAYLSSDGTRITTWMGDTLAQVTHITAKARGRFTPDKRGHYWARGINGGIYHGTHNGPGMWARMRLAKHQPKNIS
jgi:hypothetical protein